ncbi:TetR/AcrR family transcriptional regulator [Sphingobacterium oryzagri]|uniref:TetR/AcrR family transcriptional regulator n=1 Tax=Sphingobacterium oryzagri TaxID=3025669 RepID=A0ABY7WRD6_9SPHI|nr:TetR/AcrR family transcriptional regulator [Sphingobacterium sp. KACC 22765]WDF69869.1 TetR/AcrR family transcriptional regulator [Sphingobacterium sp. KACC 22765]
MGIKERKTKHKEDLRKRILEAAKKLFVTAGYEATSIRKIAQEIEFSPTTIYLYYKDKSDIIYALHQEGFLMLRQDFQPLMQVDSPFERLKAIGKCYIRFALTQPDFYEVMFMMKGPMEYLKVHCVDGEWAEGERVFDFLLQTVRDCQEVGYFQQLDVVQVAVQAWSSVHGLCSLFVSGHLKSMMEVVLDEDNQERMIEQAFRVFVHYLEATK